jgi:hypothetical protein
MNLIKTNIVDPIYDTLWEDVSGLLQDAVPRPVLVLVNDHEAGSNESIQLQKMLDACKLIPEQYNIIKLKEGQMVAWHLLREQLDPRIIFLIGIPATRIGISALFNLNHPNNFNGCIWLPTFSINELAQHEDVKKQLWINGMKPLFLEGPLPGLSKEEM